MDYQNQESVFLQQVSTLITKVLV